VRICPMVGGDIGFASTSSAPVTPFGPREDAAELRRDAPSVVLRRAELCCYLLGRLGCACFLQSTGL
jgi:hypothetical protein